MEFTRDAKEMTLEKAHSYITRAEQEINKLVFGMERAKESLWIGILAAPERNCHVLLDGPPGLAKTLLIKTVGTVTGMTVNRVQFMPDLLPGDIVGAVMPKDDGTFALSKGALFTNILIADELNRARTTVKASILQPMEEGKVTVLLAGTHDLPNPFIVMATENPVEAEGTFSLGVAELDRFLLKDLIEYPSRENELQMVRLHAYTEADDIAIANIMDAKTILAMRRAICAGVHVEDSLNQLAVDIVAETRPEQTTMGDLVKGVIKENGGASPRASLHLIRAGRVHAFLHRARDHMRPTDIEEVALRVLRHRLNFVPGQDDSEEHRKKIVSAICEKTMGKSHTPIGRYPTP